MFDNEHLNDNIARESNTRDMATTDNSGHSSVLRYRKCRNSEKKPSIIVNYNKFLY